MSLRITVNVLEVQRNITIILDSSVLLLWPEFLRLAERPEVRLVVPEVVLQEIGAHERRAPHHAGRAELIRTAAQNGLVEIVPAINSSTHTHQTRGDEELVAIAVRYREGGEFDRVILATEDRGLAYLVGRLGIETLRFHEMLVLAGDLARRAALPATRETRELANTTQQLVDAGQQIARTDARRVWGGGAIGLAVGLVLFFAFPWLNVFLTGNLFLAAAALCFAGVGLYAFRAWFRLVYGLAEVVFGLLSALLVAFPSLLPTTAGSLMPVFVGL